MQVTVTDSGLYVAEQAADYQSVSRALREHDPELRLVPHEVEETGVVLWKVFRYAGPNHPAHFVCAWTDRKLRPLPLSHSLVERVKQLDRNTRGSEMDADVENARVSAEQEKRMDDAIDEVAREAARRHGRLPVFHRGAHLRGRKER